MLFDMDLALRRMDACFDIMDEVDQRDRVVMLHDGILNAWCEVTQRGRVPAFQLSMLQKELDDQRRAMFIERHRCAELHINNDVRLDALEHFSRAWAYFRALKTLAGSTASKDGAVQALAACFSADAAGM